MKNIWIKNNDNRNKIEEKLKQIGKGLLLLVSIMLLAVSPDAQLKCLEWLLFIYILHYYLYTFYLYTIYFYYIMYYDIICKKLYHDL